jgi:hypothetical protein
MTEIELLGIEAGDGMTQQVTQCLERLGH